MSSRENALKNDLLIQDLVVYELTKGTTIPLKEADLNTVQHRFTEYKRLIRTGEFTYDELADRIFSKYGITAAPFGRTELEITDTIDDTAFKETLTEIKNIVNKERKDIKPYRWYHKIRDKLMLILSRFYINI